jgi:hypothetical protein
MKTVKVDFNRHRLAKTTIKKMHRKLHLCLRLQK